LKKENQSAEDEVGGSIGAEKSIQMVREKPDIWQ